MNRQRNWKADCRDMSYKGGEWPRDQFLQWEVEGIDEPSGRGNYYQEDAYLIAAAPAMLAALEDLIAGEDAEATLEGYMAASERARAAIRAAKGEA